MSVDEIDRASPDEAARIMEPLFPSEEDCEVVLSLLLRSSEVASSIDPICLGVTLKENGFLLNVGRLAALEFVNGWVHVCFTGSIPSELRLTDFISPCGMKTAPEPSHIFSGTVSDFRPFSTVLAPLHEAYIHAAGVTKGGKPHKCNFSQTHSPGLLEYATKRLESGHLGKQQIDVIPNGLESVLPDRIATTTLRIVRDTAIAKHLKELHLFRCQICGTAIRLGNGKLYAEAHHIQPLGSPYDGPDISENMIVLCPNHHVMCDFGAISLVYDKIRHHPSHVISQDFLDYHNAQIMQT